MPRELDIYLKLDFVHIIKVFDIIELNNRIYIFMELAEGGDLLDFIKVYFETF
jgi:serine/threonine protein kinase